MPDLFPKFKMQGSKKLFIFRIPRFNNTQCSINVKLLPVLILPLGGWDACYCIAVVSRRTVETVLFGLNE